MARITLVLLTLASAMFAFNLSAVAHNETGKPAYKAPFRFSQAIR
jgi:hypothetical protein